MKNIIIILTFWGVVSVQAQQIVDIDTYNIGDTTNKYYKDINNIYPTFTGTWEYTYGNHTFRVILWKETMAPLYSDENSYMDKIYGKFLLIENTGSVIGGEVICNSVKYFPQSDYTSNVVIIGHAETTAGFGAYFEDTCATGSVLTAGLSFKIIDNNTTPLQAEWKLAHRQLFTGESFSVPENCIITKVE